MNSIPTLSELYSTILADLESELEIDIPIFGKNFCRAIAAVQASKLKLIYLLIGNKLQKNIFIDTADPESSGGTLERFGRVKLGRNPFSARAGQYELTVTGTVGATIDASTTFKSNDDSLNPGKLYVLDSAYTLVSNPDTITVRALEAGTDSKLDIGNELTATAPIANVDKLAAVTAESVEPSAAETTAEYRRKGLEAYRQEPQGGAATDYRLWSADAQGVQQVYPYAKSGAPTEINLFVEATIADSDDGFGTPSASLLEEVEEVVDFDPDTTKTLYERGRRPVGVIVHYLPVVIKEVTIEIEDFSGQTSAIITQISNALKAEIDEIRPFVSAADVLENKNDILDVNKIISVILKTRPGSIFGTVTLNIDGVPLNTYTFENGDIPHLITPVTFS
jgi:uncharacterized phage protein gp47/JayE